MQEQAQSRWRGCCGGRTEQGGCGCSLGQGPPSRRVQGFPRQESHSPAPGPLPAAPPPDMPPLRTPAQGHSLSTAPSQRSPLQGHCLEPCAPSCPQWSSHLRGRGRGDPEAGTEVWLSLSVQGAPGRASAQTLLSWVFSSVPTPPAGPPPTAQSPPAAPQVADQTVWLDSDPSLAAPSLAP